MQEVDLLRTIRPIWIERAVERLARGSGLREILRNQLDQFFSMLEQAIETGDPAWLDSILAAWSNSLTQTDLEGHSSSLTAFLNELQALFLQVSRETLDDSHSLSLLVALNPCFAYGFAKAAQLEIQAKITFISNQLNQAQQSLERLDKSKSDFIAVAAHELKTPLTLVEGYAAMLREHSEQREQTQQEILLLEGIQKGSERLRMIIDDMIDVSLIDNNLLKLNFQPVWINRLFSILADELFDAFAERNQIFEVNEFPGSKEMTFGDPERLLQVFRNVLTNAIKFTPDGGQICINGRKLPGFIEVTIADTGIGIDPEDQQFIFDKFGRLGNVALHSSGKTKYKGGGPGLGLRIAKGIVDAHGGAVWVESTRCDESQFPGSTFHILLPMRAAPPDDKMAKIFAPLIQKQNKEETVS